LQNQVNAGGDIGKGLPTIHLSKIKSPDLADPGFFMRFRWGIGVHEFSIARTERKCW
jgi:hypothetical protein